MTDRLADAVVVVHLAFIVFVAVGGFLAWRWHWVLWLHIPAVIWAAAIVAVGFDCPLTPLEKALREADGGGSYDGGFVDRYIEDVIYPDDYTPHLRALVVVLVAVSYARLLIARAERTHRSGVPG
jgi:hypothetical protein